MCMIEASFTDRNKWKGNITSKRSNNQRVEIDKEYEIMKLYLCDSEFSNLIDLKVIVVSI